MTVIAINCINPNKLYIVIILLNFIKFIKFFIAAYKINNREIFIFIVIKKYWDTDCNACVYNNLNKLQNYIFLKFTNYIWNI